MLRSPTALKRVLSHSSGTGCVAADGYNGLVRRDNVLAPVSWTTPFTKTSYLIAVLSVSKVPGK